MSCAVAGLITLIVCVYVFCSVLFCSARAEVLAEHSKIGCKWSAPRTAQCVWLGAADDYEFKPTSGELEALFLTIIMSQLQD